MLQREVADRLIAGPGSKEYGVLSVLIGHSAKIERLLALPPGALRLMTIRSHDQYNTTIYGLDDRYRGISGGRRVVFVHPDDLEDAGVADGEIVDLVSVHRGVERVAERAT